MWVSSPIGETLEFSWPRSLLGDSGGPCFERAILELSGYGCWFGYRIPVRTLTPSLVLVERLLHTGKSYFR